jgi:hypothetical protein
MMMRSVAAIRLVRLFIAAAVAVLAGVALAWGFAEEPLTFRDPYTGQTTNEEISTIHADLTCVLALAAGFSTDDAALLLIWNQLTDSEALGPGAAISYTNAYTGAGPAFYPPPDPDVVCRGKIHSTAIWPRPADMVVSTSVTSRFGPYSPFFHFPRQNAQETGALHDWAWGLTDRLVGYEAYAWGAPADMTVLRAACRYTRTAVITTSVPAGSLEAFGVYLHSLADSYSHLACNAAMADLGMPWATHTTPPLDQSVPECDYHPRTPAANDVHGREFYTYTDALRTDAAIQHIYRELVARSQQREGRYWPIGLDAPLAAIAGAPTLSQTLYAFVHNWDFEQAAERRAYADQLAAAILAQRRAIQRLYLPLTTR